MIKSTLFKALKYVYERSIRKYLPLKYASYSGIAVKDRPLFDITDNTKGKLDARDVIIDNVTNDDHVVEIGTGRGVWTVWAGILGATVTTYEAGLEQAVIVEKTIQDSGLEERVTLIHGLIGEGIDIYGDTQNPVIPVKELPVSDVIMMDCEGAELSIINGLMEWQYPNTFIIETHPEHDSSTYDVTRKLHNIGYSVEVAVSDFVGTGKDLLVANSQRSN